MNIALLWAYKGDINILDSAISELIEVTDYDSLKIYLVFNGSEVDFHRINIHRDIKMVKLLSNQPVHPGPIEAVNYAYEYAKEWGDLFINWGIDVQIDEPIFNRIVESYQSKFPGEGGLLGLNDGFWGEKLATHCVWDNKFVEWLDHPDGGIWYNDYIACGCDNENTERAKLNGRFAYDKDLKIIHPPPQRRRKFLPSDTKIHDRELLDQRRLLWA